MSNIFTVTWKSIGMVSDDSGMLFFLYRSVNSICGFTRETLNAMIANIEGREFH